MNKNRRNIQAGDRPFDRTVMNISDATPKRKTRIRTVPNVSSLSGASKALRFLTIAFTFSEENAPVFFPSRNSTS
jgi:hypothetical protein